jgi:hypothetical protein
MATQPGNWSGAVQVRRLRRLAGGAVLVAAGLAATSSVVTAADWVERPFNPAVGSRWIVQSDKTEKDEAGSSVVGTSTTKVTALLVYEDKLSDGYRVTYRRTDSTYEGNADDPAAARAALSALQGHTYRAVTDLAGKPLRVENLGELRAALQKMVDDVAGSAADPQITSAAKKLMADLANVDEQQAAKKNLDELPVMALGQNSGLKLGEVRRQTIADPVPGASPLQNTTLLTVVEAAPDGAKVRLKLTETTDPESMRAMLTSFYQKLGASSPAVREQIDAVKEMQFTQETQTEIEVFDGMTRSLHAEMVTSKSLPGEGEVRITESKIVTVSPAP